MDKTKDGLILFAACLAAYMFSLNYNGLIQPFLMNLVEPTLRYYFIFETALSTIFIFLIGMAAIRFMSKKYAILLAPVFLAGAGAKFVKSWAWISEVASILFTDFRTFQTSSRLMDDAPYALNLGIYCLFWFFVLLISIRQSIYLIRWSFHASQDQSGDKEQYRAKSGLFGDARLGDWKKIKKIVSPTGQGVVVGEDYDPRANKADFNLKDKSTWGKGGKADLIRMDGDYGNGHILVFGASGSGKTASYVVPTCLEFMNSVIVVDPGPDKTALQASRHIREENGRNVVEVCRGQGIDVMALWAPLLTAADGYEDLAKQLLLEKRGSEFDSFYVKSGANFLGALFEFFHAEGKLNPFLQVSKFLGAPLAELKKEIGKVANTTKHAHIKNRMNQVVSMDDKALGYLRTVIEESLGWMNYDAFRNMVDDRNGNLKERTDKDDIFITLSLDDIRKYPALVKLILGTFIKHHVSDVVETPETFLIVDEAARLKYFPLFEDVRDFGRKTKMRLMLMYQNSAQLSNSDAFGPTAMSEWSSVSLTAFCSIDEMNEAKLVSSIFGDMTIEHTEENISHSGDATSMMSKSNSMGTSTRTQGVPLVRPEELRNLPNDAQVLLFRGQSAFICGKAFYFRRKEWASPEGSGLQRGRRKWSSPYRFYQRDDVVDMPWYRYDIELFLSFFTDWLKPDRWPSPTAAADAYIALEQAYIDWDDRQYAIFKSGGVPHPSWTEEQAYFARLAEHADENGVVPFYDKEGNIIP